jgi:hypothetical protein
MQVYLKGGECGKSELFIRNHDFTFASIHLSSCIIKEQKRYINDVCYDECHGIRNVDWCIFWISIWFLPTREFINFHYVFSVGRWLHGPIKVLRIILIINGFALILYTVTGLGGYLVASMLQGVSTAFFSMALQIGIIDALLEKDRSQGISLYSLFSYIPGIVGPLLALGIWQGGMEFFAGVMIGIAIITGVSGYSAPIEKAVVKPISKNAGQGVNMFNSFGQLVKNPHLFKCSVLMLVASIVFGAITIFMYKICAYLGVVMFIFAYERRRIFVGYNKKDISSSKDT